jgi:hypothetical protein
MNITRCDRMAYRYIVSDIGRCTRWLDSPERAAAPSSSVADLEAFGDPEHWWIAAEPVKARLG